MRTDAPQLWHGLDAMLCLIHTGYLIIRLFTLGAAHRPTQLGGAGLAIQIASLGPILLFPRLAFVSLGGDLLVLSLRASALDNDNPPQC